MQKDVTLRYCDDCKKPLPIVDGEQQGFYAGGDYFCSLDHMHIGEVEWAKLYDDGNSDEYYWTTWELEEVESTEPKYLATVETAYQIYAIGATEAEAKKRALDAALEWLVMGEVEMERGVPYINTKEVEEYLGCNVYPISEFGVAQEG